MQNNLISFGTTFILLLFITLNGSAQSRYVQEGKASFYSDKFIGKYTASGKKYDPVQLTAAHLTLPFGTKLKVTNLANGKWVVVEINDRGPFVRGRIIDLSKEAARRIEMTAEGVAQVRINKQIQ